MWLYDPTVLCTEFTLKPYEITTCGLRSIEHEADFLVWEEGVPVHKFMYDLSTCKCRKAVILYGNYSKGDSLSSHCGNRSKNMKYPCMQHLARARNPIMHACNELCMHAVTCHRSVSLPSVVTHVRVSVCDWRLAHAA